MSEERVTGTPNVVYNLISVSYHALQGAETYETYAKDAEQTSDEVAANLFREAQKHHRELAEQAQKLIAERVGK